MRLQYVHLPLIGRPHRPASSIQQCAYVLSATATQFEKLLKAGLENLLHRAFGTMSAGSLVVHRIKISAAPEIALEVIGLLRRALNGEHLEKDVPPGHHRTQQQ